MTKNTNFTFLGTAYQVYNTTEEMFHCVQLNKKGERKSANVKTLKTFTSKDIALGLKVGGISIV